MTRLSAVTVIKALLFLVVGVVAFSLMSNTLRSPVRGATTDYVLNFTDAEGLVEGNPVKVSGVRIGRVSDIELDPRGNGTARARVRVTVERNHKIPEHVHAAVRYADMLGARYIALSDGGPTAPARKGNEIPVEATTAPVNLTALMNGFEPLFSALDPKQVNDLAQGFVDTFAGRTQSVHLLLRQIASMGNNLSANSAVFARLVANLTTLMSTADARNAQLTELFAGLGSLTSAVVGDNGQFTALMNSGDRAVAALAEMMTTSGDSFARSLTGLQGVTKAWLPNTPAFETFLKRFPVMADRINHSGRYGGFMMLYLCNFTLKAWTVEANIFGPLHSPVCR
ncbi:MlaD family protein [Gordonia crocea]|uniref:ABC transporter substrate-binding protein n=1 Tax=Gordonia crocea TaxID=589162 RepID=A0A7I9UY37_9ACTN|nr:MlaD family protein [Gordonia crocea]GED97796.1 ABC transporter substrate-binding protein [Gordonia crocea]